MGGWKARPGSCSKGFNPKPSVGGLIDLWNGFERNKIKIKKEKIIKFCIPSILLKNKFFGKDLVIDNKKVNKVKIRIHNNIDPSWFPHKPEILYIMGLSVWEWLATKFIENSELMNPYSKTKKDKSTKTKLIFEIFLIIDKFLSL